MLNKDLEKKQEYFWNSWQNKIVREKLDNSVIPQNKEESYKIQKCYEIKSKETLSGWKIAATSKEGQIHVGVNGPMVGRLIKERQFFSEDNISLKNNFMKVVEAEFAFKVLSDFAPRSKKYSDEEVLENMEYAFAAIELPDTRILDYNKKGENILIADNACAGEFLIGNNPIKDFKNINFENFEVDCFKNGKLFCKGLGSNVLGSPINALSWLVNELSVYNNLLLKGQIILTGTCIKPFSVVPGDEVLMDFKDLGKVSCNFS